MAPDTGQFVASIMNAAWLVRHYARGGRSSIEREHRQRAIAALGLIVRDAFNRSEDFESLLAAVVDGLIAHDNYPRF